MSTALFCSPAPWSPSTACCPCPNGSDALDRIRLGDAGILLTSPEQLRNRGVVEAERHAGPNQFAARFLDQDEVRG